MYLASKSLFLGKFSCLLPGSCLDKTCGTYNGCFNFLAYPGVMYIVNTLFRGRGFGKKRTSAYTGEGGGLRQKYVRNFPVNVSVKNIFYHFSSLSIRKNPQMTKPFTSKSTT